MWDPSNALRTPSFQEAFLPYLMHLPSESKQLNWNVFQVAQSHDRLWPGSFKTRLPWTKVVGGNLPKVCDRMQMKSRISASTTRIKSGVAASAFLSPLKCLNTPFLWSRMKALVLRFPKLVLKSKIRPPGQKLRRDKNCKISKEKSVPGAILRSSGLLKHERESPGTHFHSAKSNWEPSRPLWQNFISTRFRRFRVRKWIFQKKIVLEKFYKSKKVNRLKSRGMRWV